MLLAHRPSVRGALEEASIDLLLPASLTRRQHQLYVSNMARTVAHSFFLSSLVHYIGYGLCKSLEPLHHLLRTTLKLHSD